MHKSKALKKLKIFSAPFVTYVAKKTFYDFIKTEGLAGRIFHTKTQRHKERLVENS
jgi:hypothetical protein